MDFWFTVRIRAPMTRTSMVHLRRHARRRPQVIELLLHRLLERCRRATFARLIARVLHMRCEGAVEEVKPVNTGAREFIPRAGIWNAHSAGLLDLRLKRRRRWRRHLESPEVRLLCPRTQHMLRWVAVARDRADARQNAGRTQSAAAGPHLTRTPACAAVRHVAKLALSWRGGGRARQARAPLGRPKGPA